MALWRRRLLSNREYVQVEKRSCTRSALLCCLDLPANIANQTQRSKLELLTGQHTEACEGSLPMPSVGNNMLQWLNCQAPKGPFTWMSWPSALSGLGLDASRAASAVAGEYEQVRGRPQRLERLLVVELVILPHIRIPQLIYFWFAVFGTMTHHLRLYWGRECGAACWLFTGAPSGLTGTTTENPGNVSNLHHRAFPALVALAEFCSGEFRLAQLTELVV